MTEKTLKIELTVAEVELLATIGSTLPKTTASLEAAHVSFGKKLVAAAFHTLATGSVPPLELTYKDAVALVHLIANTPSNKEALKTSIELSERIINQIDAQGLSEAA